MKLIKKLKNPCTPEYKKLKEFILGEYFPWCFIESTRSTIPLGGSAQQQAHWVFSRPNHEEERKKEIPLYSHSVMVRPNILMGRPYSTITSDVFESVYKVLEQLFQYNDISVSVIYRINFNSTFYHSKIKKTPWHRDLNFPHKNLIVYMNKFSKGWTYVKDGSEEIKSIPKEDNVIIFDGSLEHCHAVPKEFERRIILVVNYL